MLPLRLATQQYAWGVPAAIPSKVLSLARANGAEGTAAPDASEKFAELWVGTHPSAVSMIKTTTPEAAAQGTLSLEQWLERHPEALGHLLAERRAVGQPTGRLPFLMKVLSINKALPLQAHPTSDQAGPMHQAHPDMYPDAAHKPEMVISLGGFCGFAGFLAPERMAQTLTAHPQLNEVLGANNVLQYLEAVQQQDDTKRQMVLSAMWDHLLLRTPKEIAATVWNAVFTLMQPQQPQRKAPAGPESPTSAATAPHPTGTVSSSAHHPGSMEAQQAATAAALSGPDEVMKECDLALALSVLRSKPAGGASQRVAMLSAAASAWPDDPVGLLSLMLLEDVVLGPGDAAIIPAGCPHAYICGEVLEVQAASNNTIKGGLTAPDEPADKEGMVAAATGGLLQASGLANQPALQAGVSISATDAAAQLDGGSSGDSSSKKAIHEGPPRAVQPHGVGVPPPSTGSGTGSGGSGDSGGAAQLLQLYQPDEVDEFQVLHCSIPRGHKVELVVDPGPAVMLVVGGSGRATVRAAAVTDALVLDETELLPGTALFLAAGSSVSISGDGDKSSAVDLDAWITSANNRLFAATAASPAGPGAEAEAMRGLTLSPDSGSGHSHPTLTAPDTAGKAGADLATAVDPAATLTAAEQVVAGIMMGRAGSSAPANAAMAAVATGGGGGGAGAQQEDTPSAMQVD